MKKVSIYIISLLIILISCQSANETERKVNTNKNIYVLAPGEAAERVIHNLEEILPYLTFHYTDTINTVKKANYLIFEISGEDNSAVRENSRFLAGPGDGPDHGFGGSYNNTIYFTYVKMNSMKTFTEDFLSLIKQGNFFPPEFMDLFRDYVEIDQPLPSAESEIQPEEKTVAAVPKPVNLLTWNDMYPLGDLVESEQIVDRELTGNPYIDPELGQLVQFDKAGPELFIIVNHKAFGGAGHLRGLQFLWGKNDKESKLITLDLTGSTIAVKNAEPGEESNYNDSGELVYQLFCDYNPRECEITYVEFEYKDRIYKAGKLLEF